MKIEAFFYDLDSWPRKLDLQNPDSEETKWKWKREALFPEFCSVFHRIPWIDEERDICCENWTWGSNRTGSRFVSEVRAISSGSQVKPWHHILKHTEAKCDMWFQPQLRSCDPVIHPQVSTLIRRQVELIKESVDSKRSKAQAFSASLRQNIFLVLVLVVESS